MSWACRKQQVEIIESLLEIYERDYKLAETSVLNKENKKFLLRYIFLSLTENEIEEVEKISMNLAEDCKKVLVLFGDRATSVLIPIQGQENLLLRLYKNGLININSRDFNKENIGHHVGLMNRVDILKRMISIELNIFNDSKTIGNCITSSSCLGLINFCLSELNEAHLYLTAENKNIQVFDTVLQFLAQESSTTKEEYFINFFEKNNDFLRRCCLFYNFQLAEMILKNYKINLEDKKQYFDRYTLLKTEAVGFLKEIIENFIEDYDEVINDLSMETIPEIIQIILNKIPDEFLLRVNKNYLKLIIYGIEHDIKKAIDSMSLIDPQIIYNQKSGKSALFYAIQLNNQRLIKNLYFKRTQFIFKNN